MRVYSSERPGTFVQFKSEQWKSLRELPAHATDIQLTARGNILYSLYGIENNWDWFELNPQTGQTKPVAKSSWFKQGILKVMPAQRSDGRYYATVLQSSGGRGLRVLCQKFEPKKPANSRSF